MREAGVIRNYALFGAMEQADDVSSEGVPFRVVRPDHLAVRALSVGRSQDHNRVIALLDAGVVERESIERLAARHGLTEKWATFNEDVPR